MDSLTTNKFLSIFKSRKFWACFLAALSAIVAFLFGDLELWQLIQALVAAAAAYSTGVAIEDAGSNAAGRLTY